MGVVSSDAFRKREVEHDAAPAPVKPPVSSAALKPTSTTTAGVQ
jgi:hypothetical protein